MYQIFGYIISTMKKDSVVQYSGLAVNVAYQIYSSNIVVIF